MHLQFADPTEALEYAEIHAKRDEYPFCYDKNNPIDMAHYKEIQQESIKFKSFKADVKGSAYLVGAYKLE